MSIFLVRHCSALGQEPEAALSETGEQQARLLAELLAERRIARIISSPYKRAIDSAIPLANTLGLLVETDIRLSERQLGHVEDGDWISALRQSFTNYDLCLPDGESSAAAQARGTEVVHAAFHDLRLPVAIFSHGNLLTLIANYFDNTLGFDFWQALSNPDVFELTRTPSSFRLSRVLR